MKKKPQNPKLINIADIKRKRTGLFFVHMTGAQWKKSIGKTRIEDFDPVKHKNFEGSIGIPLGPDNPDIDGLVIIPAPCDEICPRSYSEEMPQGPCDCPPDIDFPHPDRSCGMIMRNGVWTCQGSCSHGTCNFRVIRFSIGNFKFFRFGCFCG